MGSMGGPKMFFTWTATLIILFMLYPLGQPCATRLPEPNWILITDVDQFIEENGADMENYQYTSNPKHRKTTNNFEAGALPQPSFDSWAMTSKPQNFEANTHENKQGPITVPKYPTGSQQGYPQELTPVGDTTDLPTEITEPETEQFGKNTGSNLAIDSASFSSSQFSGKGEGAPHGKVASYPNLVTSATTSQQLPETESVDKRNGSNLDTENTTFSNKQLKGKSAEEGQTQGKVETDTKLGISPINSQQLTSEEKPIVKKDPPQFTVTRQETESLAKVADFGLASDSATISNNQLRRKGKVGKSQGKVQNGTNQGISPAISKPFTSGDQLFGEKASPKNEIIKQGTESSAKVASWGLATDSATISNSQLRRKGKVGETQGKVQNGTNQGISPAISKPFTSGDQLFGEKASPKNVITKQGTESSAKATGWGVASSSAAISNNKLRRKGKVDETQGKVQNGTSRGKSPASSQQLNPAVKPIGEKKTTSHKQDTESSAKVASWGLTSDSTTISNLHPKGKGIKEGATQGNLHTDGNHGISSSKSHQLTPAEKLIGEKQTSIRKQETESPAKVTSWGLATSSAVISNNQSKGKAIKIGETPGKLNTDTNQGITSSKSHELNPSEKPIGEKQTTSHKQETGSSANVAGWGLATSSATIFNNQLKTKGTKEGETQGKFQTDTNQGTFHSSFHQWTPGEKLFVEKISAQTSAAKQGTESSAKATGWGVASSSAAISNNQSRGKATKRGETQGKLHTDTNQGISSSKSHQLTPGEKPVGDKQTASHKLETESPAKVAAWGLATSSATISNDELIRKATKEGATQRRLHNDTNQGISPTSLEHFTSGDQLFGEKASPKNEITKQGTKPSAKGVASDSATISNNHLKEKGTKGGQMQGKVLTDTNHGITSLKSHQMTPGEKAVSKNQSTIQNQETESSAKIHSDQETFHSIFHQWTPGEKLFVEKISAQTSVAKQGTESSAKATSWGLATSSATISNNQLKGKGTKEGETLGKFPTDTNQGMSPSDSLKLTPGGKPVGEEASPPNKVTKPVTGSTSKIAGLKQNSDSAPFSNTQLRENSTKDGDTEGKIETSSHVKTFYIINHELPHGGKPVSYYTSTQTKITKPGTGSHGKSAGSSLSAHTAAFSSTQVRGNGTIEGETQGKIAAYSSNSMSSSSSSFTSSSSSSSSSSNRFANAETQPLFIETHTANENSRALGSGESVLSGESVSNGESVLSSAHASSWSSDSTNLDVEREESSEIEQKVSEVEPAQIKSDGKDGEDVTDSDLEPYSILSDDDFQIGSGQNSHRMRGMKWKNKNEEDEEGDDLRLSVDSLKAFAATLY